MTSHIPWSSWWPVFENLESDQKVETFEYNFKGLRGWKEFVQRQSPKCQVEILEAAPQSLTKALKDVLSDEAKYKLLGIKQKRSRY